MHDAMDEARLEIEVIWNLVNGVHDYEHVVHSDSKKHERENVVHCRELLADGEAYATSSRDREGHAHQADRGLNTSAVDWAAVTKHHVAVQLNNGD